MDRERLSRLLASPERAPMVSWFHPPVLARAGVLVTIANIFGRHSDRRLLEALATQAQGAFDYSREPGDFWLDYVCDVGDGWNSTYAIANAIAQPTLELQGSEGTEITHGGRVLVFGGDEVYPYPSRRAYEQRTEKPYACAFSVGRHPDVFAVPGNHDWYDSLIAFSRTFCRPERGFAGCRTQQTRSYFALHLPHHWWLLAIDLQLGADLDEPQVQYFQRVVEAMEDDARIILCVPEPQWILEQNYPKDADYEGVALQEFEQKILKRRVQVFLTGDQHHYRRHENSEGVQKIVSGGGGAFLHPTHVPRKKVLADGFEERAAYPDRGTSWRLGWRNLLFPFLNPTFLWLPAVMYALSAWFASVNLRADDLVSMPAALQASITAAVRDPFDGLWLLAFIAAFVFFTDTHSKGYRLAGGITHALAHLLAAFAIGWMALGFTTRTLGMVYGTVPQLLTSGAITFAIGGFTGAMIMGCYLLLSLQLFGRHADTAFSSLRIQDYKQWVRLRIDGLGNLTIYAIGIDRVPRRWKKGTTCDVPDDPHAIPPRLIEKVEIRRESKV
jgi:hypothetical protein